MAPLDAKTLESLRGYLDVAYRLGLLAAGLMPSGLQVVPADLPRRGRRQETPSCSPPAFAAGLLQGASKKR